MKQKPELTQVPLLLHVWPELHVPQVPPQPSGPQVLPLQLGVQHVPELVHVWPLAQLPHFTFPPQPSGAVPQVCPAGQAVAGVQPQ